MVSTSATGFDLCLFTEVLNLHSSGDNTFWKKYMSKLVTNDFFHSWWRYSVLTLLNVVFVWTLLKKWLRSSVWTENMGTAADEHFFSQTVAHGLMYVYVISVLSRIGRGPESQYIDDMKVSPIKRQLNKVCMERCCKKSRCKTNGTKLWYAD